VNRLRDINRGYIRFRLWSRRHSLGRKLAFVLAAAAVGSGMATVTTMTGSSPSGPDRETILALLYLDVVLSLLLAVVVGRKLASVWAERRRGHAGSGLHIRLVLFFSLIAVTPAILVAIFAGLFLNFGIQEWFSKRVSTALHESDAVAVAYLEEHRKNIRADIFAIANDLNREAAGLMLNPRLFNQVLTAQAGIRGLPEALVVDSDGGVLARSQFSMSLEFEQVPSRIINLAKQGKIAVITTGDANKVRAVVKLNRFADAYLLVGRFVESGVLERIDRTQKAVAQYTAFEKKRDDIQFFFVMIFVVVALLLLLAAIWIGLTQATQIASPISKLITAAERVRKGDLSVRVDSSVSTDEIGTLSRSFNRMTSQIESQQQGLMNANRELDERRRFTETVLAGVSAGVIGLDVNGCVNLPNRTASELLGIDLDNSLGEYLGKVVPEMKETLDELRARPDRVHQLEIRIVRKDQLRTLLVNVAAERLNKEIIGYVVTFDDVTDLLSAQRTAVWADVARRIAHEIKNPLTPIQLSAERLKRKYLKEITTDPETFLACTETIVRQVEEIGRMVDEFSSFARMPEPKINPESISQIIEQSIFLERNRFPGISFNVDMPNSNILLKCDRRQISRALMNVLKNAAESISSAKKKNKNFGKGTIMIRVREKSSEENPGVSIVVEDNGLGLPFEFRDRLTEPYMTTRTKGTGLGLSIVKKIMEDHDGYLKLDNRDEGGAIVTLFFNNVDDVSYASSELQTDAQTPDIGSETKKVAT